MNAVKDTRFLLLVSVLINLFPVQISGQVKFQEYYGLKPSNFEVSHGAARSLDGGYLFAGETHDNSGLVPWDLYVIKTDSSGNKLWSKRYHNSQNSNHAAGNIIATSDSGFALAPFTNSGDLRIVKFDKVGNFLWSNQYGPGYGSPRNIIQTKDDGFAIVGDEYYFTPNVFKAYVVKTDAAGNLQWDKAIYGSGTLRGCDIIQTNDSSFVICGIDQSWSSPANVLLYKLSKTGAVVWVKSIGTTALEEAYGIKMASDNGFIIAGNININGTDVLLIKTDSMGVVDWAKAYGTPGYDGNIISHNVETDIDGGFSFFGYTMNGPLGSADLMHFKTNSAGVLGWARTYGSIYSESGYASGFQTSDGGYLVTGRRAGNLNGDLLVVKTDGLGFCGCSEATISLTSTDLTLFSDNKIPLEVSGGSTTAKSYSAIDIFGDSTIICQNITPLPVELISFSGENRNDVNQLYWQTASETNNDYFFIERSSDGINFETIGSVKGKGNSNSLSDYEFTDIGFPPGKNYYRLKQVDFDGGYQFSGLIYIKNNPFGENCHLNAINSEGYFTLHCVYPESTRIVVFDMRGKIVMELKCDRDQSEIPINLSGLVDGIYLLNITNGSANIHFMLKK